MHTPQEHDDDRDDWQSQDPGQAGYDRYPGGPDWNLPETDDDSEDDNCCDGYDGDYSDYGKDTDHDEPF